MTLRIDPKYRWLAMDCKNEWYFFPKKPQMIEPISNWHSAGWKMAFLFNIPPVKDWTKSLHRRIGKTNLFERVK